MIALKLYLVDALYNQLKAGDLELMKVCIKNEICMTQDGVNHGDVLINFFTMEQPSDMVFVIECEYSEEHSQVDKGEKLGRAVHNSFRRVRAASNNLERVFGSVAALLTVAVAPTRIMTILV